MSVSAVQAAAAVSAGAERRLQALDPLLPGSLESAAACRASLVATSQDGHPSAVGVCQHWESEPGSMDRTWGAARRYLLSPRIADDARGALDQLLAQWRAHLASVPGTDDDDTAAVVTWPSRDVTGVLSLLEHGLTPLAVIAARPTAGRAGGPAPDGSTRSAGPAVRAGLSIRRAGPGDIDEVVRLGLELIRYDALFWPVVERPESGDALRRDVAGLLTVPGPWVWLAERDGTAVGMLAAEQPAAARWIAPLTRLSPVAYLQLMFVLPGERGSGIGAALAWHLHQDLATAGVPVTLLHYGQVNPLSAPFWSQQGYRPLWTVWEARPAARMR